MKRDLLRITCVAAMMLLCMTALGAGGGGTSNKIVVVSDIHVMAPSLLPSGAETQEAWTTYYAGQRKMLQQSAAIFDQFIDNMISLQPKAVLITGDLTKDGETASHEYVRDGLERLRYNDINVYVIPGNHDFGASGSPTQFNADGTTADATTLEYDEFQSFYYNYGYNSWESQLDPNSLSYMAEPMEGLVLLAIDSHTASVSAETLEWLIDKAKTARNNGKQVIAMMHHPLFPHITGGDMYIDTYTVGDYATVRDALIDAGVNVILSGHFHTSDIAKDWKDDAAKAVYDINTGSLISYPCDYRILTPSTDFMSISVSTASIVPSGMTADECKTWLKGRAKSLAIEKMKEKAGAAAAALAAQIENLGEFVANLFILHAEGNEADSGDRAGLATTYTTYKGDATYSMLLTAGGITDASIYSILDDQSNYGTEKADKTNDRTLTSIALPEVGPFKPSEPGTITIGKAQYGGAVPLTAQYKYALSQQVFTANEINHAKGKIWSIAFNTKKGDVTRNYTIYLTHTNDSYMSSSNWQPVTAADCYFSGDVTFTSGQWKTIYFDKPFEYDGKSNIVVTVDDNTGRADGWGALSNYIFYGEGNHAVATNSNDIDPMDATSIENASDKDTYSYTNQIQLAFGDYPTPSNFAVTGIGDNTALAQCSLRGEATAWNLRYRKVAGEGEEELAWTLQSNITTKSFSMDKLTAMTQYEAQVQAVFSEDKLSAWTDPLTFTTNCCPVEQQTEIMFALNSYGGNVWYDFAVQIMDVTDEEHPFEVAHLSSPDGSMYGGTLTLCCGHNYKVNWIYDSDHKKNNQYLSFALYYDTGDKIYSMAQGTAPTSTSELTTFIMDCTPYCVQMPQIVNEAGTTYDSATLTFLSQTKTGQVVYSTEADFDPETATPEDVDFEELPQNDVPWEQPNISITLKGLQPLTAYYVSVRSVCTIEPIGTSRWTKPVKVITGSRYDSPSQPIAKPISSSSEGISWSGRGGETGYKLYYRAQGAGSPVDASAIKTFGGGNGSGFQNGSWGDGIQSSYGDHPFSNTLYVTGVPAGSSFGFNAGNGKTGAGMVKFLYGLRKFVGPLTEEETMRQFDQQCLNDADRQARIDDLNVKLAQLEVQLINGEISREEYDKQKADIDAAIAFLNSLPTDDQKLDQMRTLEQKIKDNNVAKAELTKKFVNGEITKEQYESKIAVLNAQNALYGAELSELRAITTNAENPEKDGFAISREQESAPSRGMRAPGDATYIFFIRHSDPNGVLLVKDLTITPPEQLGEWTVIDNIKGTSYTLTGLEAGTTYEVMVEPVYDDGSTGSKSNITVFTTLGTDTDPTESTFSVSKAKKVQFAKGNLRYRGDSYGYEYEWSMAKQQYEILGEANIDGSSPADLIDLLCWSTTKNYCGVYSYYYDDDPDANFKGDFVDWGTDDKLASNLGTGWSTLSKDEWDYLLTERENAATKKAVATITIDDENSVKGLLLLPDEWTAPTGTPAIDGSPVALTLAQWTALETAGAVFLPAAGQMTATYDSGSWTTTTTLTPAGSYWTATPSGDKSDMMAMTLSFDDTDATTDADLNRRIYTAVRLVKAVTVQGDANGDGKVTITDAVAVVDHILGNPQEGFNEAAADVNKDGKVNITDAVGIVDIILNQ